MRAILQRVSQATVTVEERIVGEIGAGFLILLGVGSGDGVAEVNLLAEKTAYVRVFADADGRFNQSLLDVGGAALVVSQFTLYGDLRKGRRPNFTAAAPPDVAAPLVEMYVTALQSYGITVTTGVFGAKMRVALVNEGPVTLILDSATFKQPRRQSSGFDATANDTDGLT